LVEVDRLGALKSAAWGYVPFSEAPGQAARDGEDYAILMAANLLEEPFHLYVDCAGTIGSVRNPAKATAVGNPRAHLWGKIHAFLGGVVFDITKVAAHTTSKDVEAGRITLWEQRGNQSADRYAKLGAWLHLPREEDAWLVEGMNSLVAEAASWSAQATAAQTDDGQSDAALRSQSLDAAPCVEVVDEAGRLLKGQLLCANPKPVGELEPDLVRGHTLLAATVEDEVEPIFVCQTCCSYAQHRWYGLAKECTGLAPHDHPTRVRTRQGRHPQPGDVRRISPLLKLTRNLMYDAVNAVKDPSRLVIQAAAPSLVGDPVPDSEVRRRILACYGISASEVPAFAAAAKAAHAAATRNRVEVGDRSDSDAASDSD
jgi:hypothetical protein